MCVCVCFFFFFFVFVFFFVFFACIFVFVLFFFNSWPDVNLRLYHNNAQFQFQKYKIFSFSEDTSHHGL